MMELPECFQKDRRWQILLKFGSTVLIGKNKLKFPINIPMMYENSRYIRVLVDVTNVTDFSTVTLLSDHEISYDNETFLAIWGKFNLPAKDDFLDSRDDPPAAGELWLKTNLENRVKFLMDSRFYACYFGFSIIELIDEKLCEATMKSFPVPDNLLDEVSELVRTREENLFKRRFLKFIRQIQVDLIGAQDETPVEKRGRVFYFQENLFKKWSHVFRPIYKWKLSVIEQIYPHFQVMFYDMVENLAPWGPGDMNDWLLANSHLKLLPRNTPYHVDMWTRTFVIKGHADN